MLRIRSVKRAVKCVPEYAESVLFMTLNFILRLRDYRCLEKSIR